MTSFEYLLTAAIAFAIVLMAVLAPGRLLMRAAWQRGGLARAAALVALLGLASLVIWLFLPLAGGDTDEGRIERFIGAWGIGWAAIGIVAIAAVMLRRLAGRRRR